MPPMVNTVPVIPAIMSRRGPSLLYSRVVICTPVIPPSASGKVDRPECKAVKPRPFCNSKGTRKSVPVNPAPANASCRFVVRNNRLA